MFNISNTNIITMNRGDTASFPLLLNAGTSIDPVPYSLTDGDSIYFYLCFPNEKFENAYLKKKYTKENMDEEGYNLIVTLTSEDTVDLPVGKYYYQVRIVGEGKVITAIPARIFNII